MNSILQILKVNEARKGVGKESGKAWEMQDAECIILNDAGEPEAVGVLLFPKALMGTVQPGTFLGSFSLRAGLRDRRIEAELVGLKPLRREGPGFVGADTPKPGKA